MSIDALLVAYCVLKMLSCFAHRTHLSLSFVSVQIMKIKAKHSGQLSELEEEGVEYREGSKPWTLDGLGEVFAAFPCATQNELDGEGARALVKAGVKLVMEGANMPTTAEAADALHKADAKLVTGKAANAGEMRDVCVLEGSCVPGNVYLRLQHCIQPTPLYP